MKKRKKTLLLAVAAVLLTVVIGAVCAGIIITPTVNHALHISELLRPVTEAENQALHICVSARIGDTPISLDSEVYLITEGDIQYLALEQNGAAVYVADNLLLMENAKAFKLGKNMQAQAASLENLLPRIGALFDTLKITAEKTEEETVYSVTVAGEQMEKLVAAASLGEVLSAEGIQTLELQLMEKNGKLEKIRFAGSGEWNGSMVELDALLSGFRILSAGDYPIPDAVISTVATVDPDSLFSLTEDLYRLVLALTPFADTESIDGSLELRVDCGLIQMDTKMKLSDLKTSASGQMDPEQLKDIPEMIGLICMEGDIHCTKRGDGYAYTLELDGEAMQQLSRMILPELAQYGADLTEGAVTIMLEGGMVTTMDISIEGKINVLIAPIPITVGATFTFD